MVADRVVLGQDQFIWPGQYGTRSWSSKIGLLSVYGEQIWVELKMPRAKSCVRREASALLPTSRITAPIVHSQDSLTSPIRGELSSFRRYNLQTFNCFHWLCRLHFMERIFWLICVFMSSLGCYQLIMGYQRSFPTRAVSIVYESLPPFSKWKFPAVSVCELAYRGNLFPKFEEYITRLRLTRVFRSSNKRFLLF